MAGGVLTAGGIWPASPVAREHELAELERFLDPGTQGSGALVLVGEAGIGKSTLWEAALRRATTRSWYVLSTRAAESEVQLTYVGLSDLVAGLPDTVFEALPAPQRRALRAALLRGEPGDGSFGQRAVAAGFLSVLERLAHGSPTLIAVDDAQWVDGASAALLEFAARRLGSMEVRLLLSQRAGDPEPFPFERACPGLQRVEVGPLSLAALHRVIKERLNSPLPRRRLVEIERLSAGNPLFALELARMLESRTGGDGRPPAIPASLGEALMTQIGALPRPTRGALLEAALAAEPTAWLIDGEALADAEDAAVVRIGQDGRVVFTHPLYAWAVRHRASVREQRAAHARLAEKVTDPEERVRHLARAADGPSEEIADALEQMADVARARGAPASAAELLAEARELTSPADLDQWARRCAREIPLLLEAGDWEEAWRLGQVALEKLPRGRSRAAVLLEASQFRPGAGDLVRQALDESEGDPVLGIRAELALGLQHLYEFDVDVVVEHTRRALRLARELGDRQLLAVALTYTGATDLLCGAGDPLPDLDEAIRIESELGFRVNQVGASASCYRAMWQMLNDEVEPARHQFEDLLREAVEAGDEGSQAQLSSFLGVLETGAGNWSRAREWIEASIRLADLMEFAQGRGEKRALLAMLQAQAGEIDAARDSAAEALAICTSIGDNFTLLLVLSALELAALSLNDPVGALEEIDQIRGILPPGRDPPVLLEFEGDEVEALLALDRAPEAFDRLASLQRRARLQPRLRLHVWAARGTSLLLGTQRDVAGALETIDTLLAEHDLSPAPFEYARTLLLRGQLKRRARRRAEAKATLEEALAIFERLGAVVYAEKTRRLRDGLGYRRSRSELTATEQRVADLVAAGKSNREIAAELFISRRTVEANIARVYRKTGVNSRAALATLIAGRDPPTNEQRI